MNPVGATWKLVVVGAEKLEAMLSLGVTGSRMKDFYDLWLLARHFDFDGALVAKAITATFAHRETAIDVAPIAFTRSSPSRRRPCAVDGVPQHGLRPLKRVRRTIRGHRPNLERPDRVLAVMNGLDAQHGIIVLQTVVTEVIAERSFRQ